MRSVECGICLIATSVIIIIIIIIIIYKFLERHKSLGYRGTNERTVPIIMAGCIAHARTGRISTSGKKFDVAIVFPDPDFLNNAKILAIRP